MTSRSLSLQKSLLPCLALALFCASALAEPVTGIVTNKTTGKPSPGDDVVLLQLAQGMQELARTRTDAKGHFSIEVPADGLHLLRVTHDKANYFKPVQPGTQSIEMDVFSAAASVAGVQLDADVMRIESDPGGSGLNVVEHFFVKNDSKPETTLMNAHPFELYLPPGATIQGSAAKAPGGMAVQSPLVPEDEPNKYTMIFPIRPGESEFQVSYRLQYSDVKAGFTFKPRPIMATDTIAIMMPKGMTFKPGNGAPYSPVTEEMGAQTFVARSVQPSMPLEFTVSGTGQLPRETQTGDASGAPSSAPGASAPGSAPTSAAGPSTTDTRPGGGLGVPVDPEATHDPWSKYKWFIIAGLALVFAVGAGILLRTPAPVGTVVAANAAYPSAPGYSPAAPSGGLLQVLKDETFAIETDRLEGRLSEAQYAELKSAMDIVLRRALARTAPAAGTVLVVPEELLHTAFDWPTLIHTVLMPTLLRLIQLLAMVTWVGGLVFFAFVLAPTAFHTYPSAHEAGLIVGATLRVFDIVGIVCGAAFLAVTAILFARAPMRIRGRYEMQFLLTAVMVLATAYIHLNILPSMDRDRDRAGGDITSVPETHPARAHFDTLHKRSERVESAVLLIGLAVVFFLSREQLPRAPITTK